MARTQAEDYEEKREAILDEAARLFAQRGFAGASVADLADACGMSKSLFYHYYPSKESILYAVAKGHMDELLTALDGEAAKTPVNDLRGFARRLMKLYAGAADKQKVLLYELSWLPKRQREDIVAKEKKLVDHVVSIIKRARPREERAYLRAQAMLFFGMLNWTHNWLKPKGRVTAYDVADMAARMALSKPL